MTSPGEPPGSRPRSVLSGPCAAALLLVACSATGPTAPATAPAAADDAWLDGRAAAPAVEGRPPPSGPWDWPAILGTLTPAAAVPRSLHLADDLQADVLVDAATQGYPAPPPALPPGAVIAEALRRPGGAVLVHFVMRKRSPGSYPAGGDWDYAVFGPDGRLDERAAPEVCARCHAEAPHSFVFGTPPRSP